MQALSSPKSSSKSVAKGWKLPIIMCSCNPDDETPDNIINKICSHPNCSKKRLFCSECVNNQFHELKHEKSIQKIKDFLEETVKTYQLFKDQETDIQDFDLKVINLYNDREKLLKDYQQSIEAEIVRVDTVFNEVLDEVKAIMNERKDKLTNYLNKSYQIFEKTFNLFNNKMNRFNENWEFFKKNSFPFNQQTLNQQLSEIKTSDDFNVFINNLQSIKNKLATLDEDSFDKIKFMSEVLEKYVQTTPHLKLLPESKTKRFPLLDSLDLKSPFISAQKRLSFHNSDLVQELCTDMLSCLDFEDKELVEKIKDSFLEFEYFMAETKLSEDYAVTAPNHFQSDFSKPFIHFFHFHTKDLYLLHLPKVQTKLTQEDCAFLKIPLDIDFLLPSNHASISTPDGRLFLNGGKGGLERMYEMDFENNRLIPRKSMKQRRWDHAICLAKGNIYCFGGADTDDDYKLLRKCERYDVTLDAWTEIASFTTECSDFSVCNFNDKYIYKFGGWNSISYVNVIEKYDIEFDQWVNINPPLRPMLGGFPECIQINERQIYIFGGYYVKGHDENFLLEIDESNENDEWASHYGIESIKLPNKIQFPVRSQFKMPKNVIIHNGVIYTIYKNRDQSCLLGFDGRKWSILNENIYQNCVSDEEQHSEQQSFINLLDSFDTS